MATRRPSGRKASNSDQTDHVNGDLRQQHLFELPHKQTLNELVRGPPGPLWNGTSPTLGPCWLGPANSLVLSSHFHGGKKKSLLIFFFFFKKMKRGFRLVWLQPSVVFGGFLG